MTANETLYLTSAQEQRRLFKELEMAYEDLSAYSQHPMFRQEEREAQQRITALQEALDVYTD
jgi:hypothetical protein